MTTAVFSPGFKTTPYWWDRAPLADIDDVHDFDDVDVAIVGGGYTGLHAAIMTARAGLSTYVFDAEAVGFGCSSRNGGQISPSFNYSTADLVRKHGTDLATALGHEGIASLTHIGEFIQKENIDCNYAVNGRLHLAHSPRAFSRLQASLEEDAIDRDAYSVLPEQIHTEIGSDAYFGAAVYPHDASVDPARYHAGLMKVAASAGVRFVAGCPVLGIEQNGTHPGRSFQLHTRQRIVKSRQVLVATNGYTGQATPWLHRRIIPIGSYMIATEELPRTLMDELLPTDRVITDTRTLIYYYRPSPDRKRIIFGGRVSLNETDLKISGGRLLTELRRLFPSLHATRISHSWSGTVAFSFDSMMHCGEHEGVHYAMAYCGSGVAMSGYLGMRMGNRMVGLLTGDPVATEDGRTAFDQLSFSTRPLYRGVPWFLAPSVFACRVKDRFFS